MRVIRLPALERSVTLGAYVRAVRLAIARPGDEFRHGLDSWWPTTGEEIRRQFRRAMHARISEAVPYSERGSSSLARGR